MIWKFCPHCGHKLEAAWRFCAECGAQIGAQPAIWPEPFIWPQPGTQPYTPYIWPQFVWPYFPTITLPNTASPLLHLNVCDATGANGGALTVSVH